MNLTTSTCVRNSSHTGNLSTGRQSQEHPRCLVASQCSPLGQLQEGMTPEIVCILTPEHSRIQDAWVFYSFSPETFFFHLFYVFTISFLKVLVIIILYFQHSIALTLLECTMQTRLNSNSQRFPRLYLLSAGTEGGTTMLFKSSSIECGPFPGRTYDIFPSVL